MLGGFYMSDTNLDNIKKGVLYDIWQVNHLRRAAESNCNLISKYLAVRGKLFIKLDTVVMPLSADVYKDLCSRIA